MARNFCNYVTATIILILFSTTTAIAATLTVVPSTGSTFTVQGTGLGNVGGMELSISYGGSSLATPKVTEGSLISGALIATNTNTPGSIKIAIIATTAISGNGPVAVINFASKTETVHILSFNASMIDSKGIQIPVQSIVSTGSNNVGSEFISTPGVPFSQPPTPSISATTSTPPPIQNIATTTSTPPPTPDTTTANDTAFTTTLDTMPDTSGQAPLSTQPVEQPPAAKPIEAPTTEKQTSDQQKPGKDTTTAYTGTLENFLAYKGDKSPSAFTALFDKEIAPNIRQEPAIAMSDGKMPLKVLVKLGSASNKSPNFALNSAKLVSLNKDNSSTWIIVALPQSGIVQASLTIMTDNSTIVYPLTLAPPAESVTTSIADFATFLKDSGAASPRYDFNKDKKHDYIDDFIYTANYLFKKSAAEKTK